MANRKPLEFNEVLWCNECEKQTPHVFTRAWHGAIKERIFNEYACRKCGKTHTIRGESPKRQKFVFR